MVWNIYVNRDGAPFYIGFVFEDNEILAREAALSLFAITEHEIEVGEIRPKGNKIYPGEDFSVVPA